jgi:uncharacterized membrane protein HdeD (DUF308 family)
MTVSAGLFDDAPPPESTAGKSPVGLLTGGPTIACGLALVFNPTSTLGAVSSLVAVSVVADGAAALLFSSPLDS